MRSHPPVHSWASLFDQDTLDQFGVEDLGEVFADEVEARLGLGIHDGDDRDRKPPQIPESVDSVRRDGEIVFKQERPNICDKQDGK